MLNAFQNSKTYTTTDPKAQEKQLNKQQKFWDSVLWSDKSKLELIGPMDQWYVWRKNEAYAEKNTV